MSVRVMSIVWESELERSHKFVLLAYADHADDEGGGIFPALGRIAWKTSYSIRQVRRITRELEAAGIMIEEGKSKYGTTVYRIDVTALPPLPPYVGGNLKEQGGADILTGGGGHFDHGADISGNGADIAVSADPSLESSLESSDLGADPVLVSFLNDNKLPLPADDQEWALLKHPAVMAWLNKSNHWPTYANMPYLIDHIGETPNIKALDRAVYLWRGSGGSLKNIVAVTEWYNEIKANPEWVPSDRFKSGKNGNIGNNRTSTIEITPVDLHDSGGGIY